MKIEYIIIATVEELGDSDVSQIDYQSKKFTQCTIDHCKDEGLVVYSVTATATILSCDE